MNFILIKEIFTLGIVVLLAHFFALKSYLYWTVEWFDILMHFLGGLLIGLIIISFLNRIHREESLINKKLLIISIILGVLAVGLGWELWEIFVGFTDIVSDRVDTFVDLVMDLFGGVVAIGYYYFKYWE